MASNKKKSPILFFVGAFALIFVLVFIVNRRSGFEYEVRFPLNNGVVYLYTRGDYLAAVCHDNKVYIWDWHNLSAKFKTIDIQSEQAGILESNKVVSVKRSDADAIVVTDLSSGKTDSKIPIAAEDKKVWLCVNRSGQTVVAAIENVKSHGQEVVFVDCNAGLVRPIAELGDSRGGRITDIAVSDRGDHVVLTGEKAGRGHVVLIDVKQHRVAWVEELTDLQKVRSAIFSTDGKVIYIRGTDSTVQVLDPETGKVIKRLLPVKENSSTADDQHVQTLATSEDGRSMAATISSTVYMWDCKTQKLIFRKMTGHKLVSGLAFSPDSKYLATSDGRQGGTIKIWRIPKH